MTGSSILANEIHFFSVIGQNKIILGSSIACMYSIKGEHFRKQFCLRAYTFLLSFIVNTCRLRQIV